MIKETKAWYQEKMIPGWLESQERKYLIFDMRKRGMAWRDIAAATTVGVHVIKKEVAEVLKELADKTIDEATEYRALNLAVLNDLIANYYEDAIIRGNEKKGNTLLNALKQRGDLFALYSVANNSNTTNLNSNEINIIISDNWRNPNQSNEQAKELPASNEVKIDEKMSIIDSLIQDVT